MSDLRIGAHVLPAGLYYRALRRDKQAAVQGHEVRPAHRRVPRARLRLQGVELGAEARSDRFSALRVLDPLRPAHGMAPIYENRRRGEIWLSVGPPSGIARATFFVDGYQRGGTAGDVSAEQHELGCGGRLEAVF